MTWKFLSTASHGWLAAGLLLTVGCTGGSSNEYDATVQGTVTIDGELAPRGAVTFTPVGKGPAAVGSIGPDGSYALRVGQGTAGNPDRSVMPSGKYVATVDVTGPPAPREEGESGPLRAGPRLIADKYARRETSGLEFTVTPGMNVIPLKLEGPWANPPQDEANDDAEGDAPSPAAEDAEGGNPSGAPGEPADGAGDRAAETAPADVAPAESAPADPAAAADPAPTAAPDGGAESSATTEDDQ
ncbi:MAG TPA: hypothetical protein VEQ85_00090 [Lacipirellulaceae bacterium]|nr:hypothetical protein [Lacipirellulaceae bacterium]